MSRPIRIAVVDPDPLYRAGVGAALKMAVMIEVVAEGATAVDALRISKDLKPDILLLTIHIQGDGLAATRTISTACPAIKIVILTSSESKEQVRSALTAGARAYILRRVSGPELIEVLEAVQRGQAWVTPSLAARFLRPTTGVRATAAGFDPTTGLTWREHQILDCVARGLSNKEVARIFQIKDKTVKCYMTNIMEKLQVRNRVEATMLVISLREKKRAGEGGMS